MSDGDQHESLPARFEAQVSRWWPWLLAAAIPIAVVSGSLWPIALVVLLPLVLRGWRMRDGRQLALYREITPRVGLEALVAAAVVLGVAVAILSLDFAPLNWGWFSLVSDAIGGESGPTNIVVVPLEIPILAVPFLALLLFVLPDLAMVEERVFRVGTRDWLDGVRRSVVFGAAHLVMGIPIGAVAPLTLAGLWLTWHYFRGGARRSARYHLAYNAILVVIATLALAAPALFPDDAS
jgi:hypothetical protein